MYRFICYTLFLLIISVTSTVAAEDSCPLAKIRLERLPDLHVARAGHLMFSLNGEVMVAGGHTTDFKPTSTAEYYRDGQWHLLEMAYPHDNGFGVLLSSGKVMLGGGHDRNLGQGQTFEVEMYDPATHTFEGFSCLDKKRTLATAAETEGGQVVIAGNWYTGDSIEVFDGSTHFQIIRGVSVQRAKPYIFPTSDGDALIFSSLTNRGEVTCGNVIDRLKGGTLHIPLLETWFPIPSFEHFNLADCTIGDYTYLLPLINLKGELAIAQLSDTVMTLLPTAYPLPQSSPWDSIAYVRDFVCNRRVQRAYLLGYGSSHRLYVLCVDYSKRPFPLTLFYTDPIPEPAVISGAVLTSEGQLMLAGGNISCGPTKENYNYKPSAASWLLYVGAESSLARKKQSDAVGWWGIIILSVLLLGLALLVSRIRKARINHASQVSNELTESYKEDNEPNKSSLYDRLCQLMEEEQLFLNRELRIQDVAVRLSANSRYVSECIKTELDCTFTQFVNTYRIKYAQKLLREQADIKISNVSKASGFSGESSFFRTFRTMVGMTPREWLDTIQKE